MSSEINSNDLSLAPRSILLTTLFECAGSVNIDLQLCRLERSLGHVRNYSRDVRTHKMDKPFTVIAEILAPGMDTQFARIECERKCGFKQLLLMTGIIGRNDSGFDHESD